jgi:AmiR/NasT family two-component response regulator
VLARRPRAFDDDSVLTCDALAAHAAIALAHADRELHLRRTIDSREMIGQAIGIVMDRYRLTAGSAFDLLVAAAQRQRVKLRDLTRHVVKTGEAGSVDAQD